MGEGIRDDIALMLLLKPVVTNLASRVHGLFNVARFNQFFHLISSVCPDPGKAIGLELQHNREFVVFSGGNTLSPSLNLIADAK